MNTNPIYKWVLFFLIFCGQKAYPQHAPDQEYWLKELFKIEESKDAPLVKTGNLEHLLSSFEKEHTEKDSIYARIANRLGDYYCNAGNLDKGIELLKIAVNINRSSDSPLSEESFLANSYYNLGFYYGNLNLFDEFHLYMDSCISIAKKYPKMLEVGIHAYEQLALHYNSTGEYHKSKEIAENGLFFNENYPANPYTALLYLQTAQAELDLGYKEADTMYTDNAERNIEKALQILSEVDAEPNFFSIAFAMKSRLLVQKGDIKGAVSFYEKALEIDLSSNNYINAVKIKSNIGILYDESLGEANKALEIFQNCFELLKKVNLPNQAALQEASVYNNMGALFFFSDDYSNAIKNFQLGIDALLINNFSNTKQGTSLDQTKMMESIPILRSLYANKGETILTQFNKSLIKRSDLFSALNAFKLADKAIDQMRWNQHNQQSKLIWRKQTKKMYDMAIEVCFLLQDMENAFYFFEKSRAVLLNDKLNELGANQYLSGEDQEKEKNLRIQLISAQQKLLKLQASGPEDQQQKIALFKIQDSYEKFIKSLEKKYPNYYLYKYDTAISTMSDLRSKVLDKGQTFIGYFTGQTHIYALTIDAHSSSLTRIATDLYNEKATELLTLIADRSSLNQNYSRYSELAHDLYKSLFKPLSIQTQRVIISPDDHFIPFELLLKDKNMPTSFLLQDHAFSYTYSAGYLMKNRQEKASARVTLLGIAPVNYKPYLQQASLSGADLSLNNIKSNFSSSKSFINEKATKNEFLKSLPLHSMVHLYSHAEADNNGTEPTLYFYDSALLVSELQMLGNLPTELIVLSACNTGVGKNVKGEGVFSLARGFAAAGIPSSITSLWQIDNQSTYLLTELFYENLSQGLPLDIALQEAKLEFLRIQDKSHDLPYFWAATILIGKSEGFLQEKDSFTLAVPNLIAGILLLLFFISTLLYYKKGD